MPVPKGTRVGGRKKGTPNKSTINAKNAIVECFTQLGGVDALARWAKRNKGDFYTKIWPKVIPLTLAGDKDNPVQITLTNILADIDGTSAGLPSQD